MQATYPTGTPLTTVNAAIAQMAARFAKLPDVDSQTALAGGTQSNFGGLLVQGSVGQIHVFLKSKRKRARRVTGRRCWDALREKLRRTRA